MTRAQAEAYLASIPAEERARVNATDARQRAMAALALGEIGRLDAQPHIRPLLDDADAYVRLSAATAMLKLAESAEPRMASERR